MTPCGQCDCHNGGEAFSIPCSIPGGCGHLHRNDTAPSSRCGMDPQTGRWSCGRMTSAGLDEGCASRLGGWLAELGDLLPQLPAALVPGSAGEGPRVTGSRDAPMPLRLSVLNLLGPSAGRDRRMSVADGLDPGDHRSGEMQHGEEPLPSVLRYWARLVAEARSMTAPTDGALHSMRRLLALRSFLARHHDWITAQHWAGEYAADVHAAWRTCRSVLGTWPLKPEHCDGVFCPRCDAAALYRIAGQDGRLCDLSAGGCGKWYDDDESAQWVRLSAHFAKVEGYRERDQRFRERVDLFVRRHRDAEGATGHLAPCRVAGDRRPCERCEAIVNPPKAEEAA